MSTVKMSPWLSNTGVNIFRLIFLVINLTIIIIGRIIACQDGDCFGSFRFFSIQTQYLLAVWWIFAIIWRNNPEQMKRLTGPVQGALVVYGTVTSVMYTVLLFESLTGIDFWINITIHYVAPIGFILDWILTERTKYRWTYLLYWLAYPVLYTVFALVYSALDPRGDDPPIYSFVDINELGFVGFLPWFLFLLGAFLIFGLVYMAINKFILAKDT